MRERVRIRIGDLSYKIFIGTFHSFGLKVLRENYEALGYERNINILDRDDTTSIIKKQISIIGYLMFKMENIHWVTLLGILHLQQELILQHIICI